LPTSVEPVKVSLRTIGFEVGSPAISEPSHAAHPKTDVLDSLERSYIS